MEASQKNWIFSIASVRGLYLAKFDFSSFHSFQSNYFITVPSVGLLFTNVYCLWCDKYWLYKFMQSFLYRIQVKAGNESVHLFSVYRYKQHLKAAALRRWTRWLESSFILQSKRRRTWSLSCGITYTISFCFYSGGLRLKYRPRHWRSWSSFFFCCLVFLSSLMQKSRQYLR